MAQSHAIRRSPYEVLLVFDTDGRLVARNEGSALSVEYPEGVPGRGLWGQLSGRRANQIVVHNHTEHLSLSSNDLHAAAFLDNREAWVVTEKGVFKIARPEGGWPPAGDIRTAYRAHDVQARLAAAGGDQARRSRLQRGITAKYTRYGNEDYFHRLSPEEWAYAQLSGHLTVEGMAKRFGIPYWFEPWESGV